MAVPEKISIETPRLVLSDFSQRDFSAFREFFESLHTAGQHWFNVDAEKPESAIKFFRQILINQRESPRHTFRLAVRENTAHRVIGYASLCNIYSTSQGDVLPIN